ncbi:MAG: transaldolase [Solirubrobacteraceae bacterium]
MALSDLAKFGQSPWVDHLSRSFVADGELGELVDLGVVGVTSNPTIFASAISEGDDYDDQLRDLLSSENDDKEVFWALARDDVRAACDVLAPVFERGDATRDGWVSLEVDPNLAFDTDETISEAKRLHGMVDRPNLFVKIPGTQPGLKAIEETIAAGIPVNVTLLFSLDRHREAAEAYLRGLKRLHESGGDLNKVASVASFFVSRVDTEADKRLDKIGGHDDLKGKLAIANAKLAYQTYNELFSGPEWEKLEQAGGSPQRCLWASTSTKNPDYPDTIYVDELIGPNTVNTMPVDTIKDFDDHGTAANTLESGVDEARQVLQRLAEAGVDYDDVVKVLEDEGVQKFADSFKELLEGVASKRHELVAS